MGKGPLKQAIRVGETCDMIWWTTTVKYCVLIQQLLLSLEQWGLSVLMTALHSRPLVSPQAAAIVTASGLPGEIQGGEEAGSLTQKTKGNFRTCPLFSNPWVLPLIPLILTWASREASKSPILQKIFYKKRKKLFCLSFFCSLNQDPHASLLNKKH